MGAVFSQSEFLCVKFIGFLLRLKIIYVLSPGECPFQSSHCSSAQLCLLLVVFDYKNSRANGCSNNVGNCCDSATRELCLKIQMNNNGRDCLSQYFCVSFQLSLGTTHNVWDNTSLRGLLKTPLFMPLRQVTCGDVCRACSSSSPV